MTHIYVCKFSNGVIKVGRSIDPHSRISAHSDRVSCVGIEIVEKSVFACKGSATYAERELIDYCSSNSIKRFKNEWFSGLNFDDVCIKASEFSEIERSNLMVAKRIQDVQCDGFPFHVDVIPNRYQYINGAWSDSHPHLPHWPPVSCVTRWELRPDDWFKIWPDLHNHPLTYLFAATHPAREGAPKFKDWVNSIPLEYFFTDDGEIVRKKIFVLITNGEVTRKDLRPNDFWKIWPDLSKEEEGVK